MNRRIVHSPSLNAGRKPRVLLVDDHRQVLDTVAAMLSDDFDVVGTATDGTQVLDKAVQTQPDVIVMDVEMPGLDGFQTLRSLNRSGFPTPPVVFLSMHDADDIVGEAFRCGAKGYVLKRLVGRDLVTALDQALLGRSFVPSPGALLSADEGTHAMQLYNSAESFVDGLADLFDAALWRGDATCLVGTRALRESVGERLRTRGWDVTGSSGHKRYLAIDSTEALRRIMRDGLPERNLLARVVNELDDYRRAEGEGATPRLTVGGSMSALLAEEGDVPAVIAVESLWSELTRDLPFLTVCGYASSCFHDGVPDLWPGVCGEHRALIPAKDI